MFRNGFIPEGKGALGIIGTAVEDLSFSTLSLNDYTVTILLRASHSSGQGLGKCAGGIIGAG